jgi:16S rRNA processing protein RimM
MSDWLEVGKIVAAQGLNGEVRVYPDSDFPDRFEKPGVRWLLYPGHSEPQSVQLLHGRYLSGKGLYVVRFEGIRDRTQAEQLKGCRLLVPEDDRPALQPGEFHILDLIGLSVFNQLTQTVIGTIVSIIPAGNDLLEVECIQSQEHAKSTTVLIPFVNAIVPIVDLEQGRVEIVPPPGLLELTQYEGQH